MPAMSCTFSPLELDGLLLIQPKHFDDERGSFMETRRLRDFRDHGVPTLVQENESRSSIGVIRGLHFQLRPHGQGKLVRAAHGSIFDVAVDVRRDSPTFGQHVGVELSAENRLMLWVPGGFAHGFQALENNTIVVYKVTDYWAPRYETGIRYDDPELAINWPIKGPIVSEKDKALPLLADSLNPASYRAELVRARV